MRWLGAIPEECVLFRVAEVAGAFWRRGLRCDKGVQCVRVAGARKFVFGLTEDLLSECGDEHVGDAGNFGKLDQKR